MIFYVRFESLPFLKTFFVYLRVLFYAFCFFKTEYQAILSFDYTGAGQCFSDFYNSPDENIDSSYPVMTGSLLIR